MSETFVRCPTCGAWFNITMKVRPGEFKILRALLEGEKCFTELEEITGLSHTYLAESLKRLFEEGILGRWGQKWYLKKASLVRDLLRAADYEMS